MKLYSLILALCGIMAVALLGGCSDGGKKTPAPTGFTSATLTMKWPSRTRFMPLAAESIKLELTTPSGYNQTQIVNRPAGGDNSTVTFSAVPVGAVTVTATAFPEADAQGVAQATGTKTASGVVGVPLRIVLTMGSTIDHLTIAPDNTLDPDDINDPDNPNNPNPDPNNPIKSDFDAPYVLDSIIILNLGKTVQFAATPYNSDGEVVLVHPGNITWTSLDTSVVSIDPNTGMLTAKAPGKTIITALEAESHKRISVNVTVLPQYGYSYFTDWGQTGYVNYLDLDDPEALAVDHANNVFIADTWHDRIHRVTETDLGFTWYPEYATTTWGGTGTGNGEFTAPRGVALDSDANVYVTDDADRVQKFTNDGTFIASWGSYGHNDGEFDNPTAIAISESNQVYVIDSGNARVQWFGPDGAYRGQWAIPVAYGEVATGLAVDKDENVYVADYYQGVGDPDFGGYTEFFRVRKYTASGAYITEWKSLVPIVQVQAQSEQNPPAWTTHPVSIAFDGRNNLYMVDPITCRIQKYDQQGRLLAMWSTYGYGHGFTRGARAVAVCESDDSLTNRFDGYVYVSDVIQNLVVVFKP